MKKMGWVFCYFIICSTLNGYAAESGYYNVRRFGAKGDGSTKDTQSLQKAIDACSRQNGGTVYFPPGRYLSGSLHLKSRVALYLDHGAIILASPDDTDFDPYETLDFKNAADRETSFFHFALIWGEDVEHIAIIGTGEIDGNRSKRGGPKPIALKRCRHLTIRDITLRNAPNYNISLLGTDHVLIDGVKIFNGYSDGIDPDACQFVQISNCFIESRDDAIVPKASFSLGVRRATEYLTVSNCILITECNGFKLGTESGGDFKNIAVSNCVMPLRPDWDQPTTGVSLESVDGSGLENIAITNVVMEQVFCPIFLRLGNRGRDQAVATPGYFKNVTLSNITASKAQLACFFSGIPDHPLENVSLSDLNLTFTGGAGRELKDRAVPEKIAEYPSPDKFGDLPSYGIYGRHIKGLSLHQIRVSLWSDDLRSAFYGEDIEDLKLESFQAEHTSGAEPLLRLVNVRRALIRGLGLGIPQDRVISWEPANCNDVEVIK